MDSEELPDSRERTESRVLWFFCEGQQDVRELFSDNFYLSAILDRQVLLVAAPIDLRTRKAEGFSPHLLQVLWSKLKRKNPKIAVTSPECYYEGFQAERSSWPLYHLCLFVAEHQILGGKHFLIFGPRPGKILLLKKVQYFKKKYHFQWTSRLARTLSGCFLNNLGNLFRPLEFVPASGERVVPTDWDVRTLLENCMSRARVIPVQPLQYRQYALISDFLDLAHLSTRKEGALATNWIKDRPERLKIQNLALATMKGPVLKQFTA